MREFYGLLLSKSFYKYIAEGRSTRFIGLKMRHLPAGMRGFSRSRTEKGVDAEAA
jgi:hypothetical protein